MPFMVIVRFPFISCKTKAFYIKTNVLFVIHCNPIHKKPFVSIYLPNRNDTKRFSFDTQHKMFLNFELLCKYFDLFSISLCFDCVNNIKLLGNYGMKRMTSIGTHFIQLPVYISMTYIISCQYLLRFKRMIN